MKKNPPENFKSRRPVVSSSSPDDEDSFDALDLADTELPLDAEPFGSAPPPPVFANILETLLQRLKLNVSPVAELLRADWGKLLPPDLAARCRPGKLHNQTLYLYVPDSSALFQLRPQLPRIEASLKPALASARVRNIRLMIDPDRDPFGAKN